jgi:O-antigen/teichoic acid export membrane protein
MMPAVPQWFASRVRGVLRAGRGGRAGGEVHPGILALADQIVYSAATFLSGMIIGRACSKGQFGAYMLGMNVVLFLIALQQSLIVTPYVIYVPRLQGRAQRRYTGSVLIHQGGLCALAVAALVALSAVMYLAAAGSEFVPVAAALAAVAAFLMFRDYARQVCFAHLRIDVALGIDLLSGTVQVGALLALSRLGLLTAGVACWTVGLAAGLAVAGWLVWMRGRYSLQLSAALADFRGNWAFGKWLFAGGLVWAVTTYLYPWALVWFHGTAAGGTWAACFGVVGLANPIVLGVQNFLGPSIAHAYAESGAQNLRRHALRAMTTSAVVLAPLLLLYLLCGGRLVTMVYGAKYAGNQLLVAVLGVNLLIGTLVFAFSRALFVLERASWDFLANVVGLLTLLVAGLGLAAGFGPLGTACGMLLCSATSAVVRIAAFFYYCRSTPAGPSPEIPAAAGEPLGLLPPPPDGLTAAAPVERMVW